MCEDFNKYGQFPILTELRDLFIKTAQGMREGGDEFIHAPEWLDIYWPPEEYALIKLCVENKLEDFYREAEQALSGYLADKNIADSTNLLKEAIKLNRALLKIPFQTENIEINLNSNILDIYKAVRVGEKLALVQGQYKYMIDRTTERWDSWEEWYEKMVWWCNRRGAYLYGNINPHQEIAGHH